MFTGFVGSPLSSKISATRDSYHRTPTCSAVSRRRAIQIACISLSSALLPKQAEALSLNEKKVISNLDKIALSLDKAKALKTEVQKWTETLSEEDFLYVLRYIPIWLEPGRVSMNTVATQTAVDIGDPEKAKQLAGATLGHLLELKAEAKGRAKEAVIREIDEFVETADDFLSIPALQKLKKR